MLGELFSVNPIGHLKGLTSQLEVIGSAGLLLTPLMSQGMFLVHLFHPGRGPQQLVRRYRQAYTYIHIFFTILYIRFHMSIFVTTPPSQEGGVDSFGLFASILSHYMYLLMCRSSSRYIYLYYVLMLTYMHDKCLHLCMHAGIFYKGSIQHAPNSAS